MYLKVSSRNLGTATEIPEEQVASQTEGLEEHIPTTTLGASKLDVSHIHMQAALAKFETADPSDKKKNKVMVERSWRVSPDEFIVKIDASPLHQSAARRMFDPKSKQKALQTLEATTEGDEDKMIVESQMNENGEGKGEEEPSEQHHSDFKDFWNRLTTVYFGVAAAEKK